MRDGVAVRDWEWKVTIEGIDEGLSVGDTMRVVLRGEVIPYAGGWEVRPGRPWADALPFGVKGVGIGGTSWTNLDFAKRSATVEQTFELTEATPDEFEIHVNIGLRPEAAYLVYRFVRVDGE